MCAVCHGCGIMCYCLKMSENGVLAAPGTRSNTFPLKYKICRKNSVVAM